MAACIFCEIIVGRVPSSKVWSDDHCVAFLDTKPLFPGHVLLVPRQHFETFPELPAELVGPLFLQAQRLARAVEKAMKAEGTFIAINNRVSQSVPHLHVHVAPRRRKDGLRGFFWPRTKYESDGQREEVCERIRRALD